MGVSSSLVLGLSGSCEVMVFLSRFSMLLVLRRLLSVEVFLLRFYSRFLFLMVIGKAVANREGHLGTQIRVSFSVLSIRKALGSQIDRVSSSFYSQSSGSSEVMVFLFLFLMLLLIRKALWLFQKALGCFISDSVTHGYREGCC